VHCPRCGTQAEAGASFCEQCGTQLPRTCEKCGAAIGATAKFCRACGTPLSESHPVTSVASADDKPTLTHHLARTPGHDAERRQLTVLFCDLVGSTALAEQLDPEELRDLMQTYQRASGEVIARYEGHVAQYLGDGLMVYFGWPHAHEDDAVRAIRSGLEIVEAVSGLKAAVPIRARVGIHTGLVVVGETGQGDASIPKAAVGETPNIAARLQSLAEPSSLVVSERTRSLAAGLFDYTDMGPHSLKGVSQPVHLSRVVSTRATESRFDASRGEVVLTPLVGREEEIALLVRRWQQAKEGEGQVVLVGGEPGIGKSRLTRVLRDRLGEEPHMVLRYQCSPFHVNSALYPVIEQFERAAGFTREDSAEQKLDKMQAVLVGTEQQLAEGGPLFAALLSLSAERYPTQNLSPQRHKEKTLDALAGHIEALAQRQPLLLMYEDVHWIDATSQEALDLLVPRLRDLPVLLVVTHRPEYTPRWTDQAHVTVLSLNRLGRRQGAELVAKVTAGKPLPKEVLDQVLAHTDGVPLFLEELTKSVLESKLLRETTDGYIIDAPLPAFTIPTTLRDSLIARLDRLAPVREVAQIGACIGRAFSYDLVAAVSPLRGERLNQALEELSKTGLVFRRGTPTTALYTFKHALVQDAAYDSLLKSKRVQIHRQIAQVLENDFPETVTNEPETLAHHYARAGLDRQAVEYWKRAAERALQRGALPEAISHLNEGLTTLQVLPESDFRARLELLLQTSVGHALIATKGFGNPEVARAFDRAQRLCELAGDTSLLFPVLIGQCVFHQVRLEHERALEISNQCVVLAEREQDADLLVEAHRVLGNTLIWLGRGQAARTHLERSLTYYDPKQHQSHASVYGQDPAVGALSWLTVTLWVLGFPDQALNRAEEAWRLSNDVEHPFSQAWARLFLAFVRALRKEWEVARDSADACIAFSKDQGFPAWIPLASMYRGKAMSELGQPRQAIEMFQQSLAAFEAVGEQQGIPFFLTFLAEACAADGRADEGLRIVDDALTRARKNSGHWCESLLHNTKGKLLLTGRAAEAETCFWQAIQIARAQEAKSFELQASMSLSRLWQGQGKRREAHTLLAPIYNWFTEGFDTRDLREAKALLEELR